MEVLDIVWVLMTNVVFDDIGKSRKVTFFVEGRFDFSISS